MNPQITASALPQQHLRILAYVPDMWLELKTQITPFNSVIAIRGRDFFALNADSQFWILNNLRNMLQAEVNYVRDSVVDRVFLGPTIIFPRDELLNVAGSPPILFRGQSARNSPSASTGTSSVVSSSSSTTSAESSQNARGSAARKNTAPRPPNAFILYRKEQHLAVKAQNPGINNNKISVILGAKWQSETEDVRNHFQGLANKMKQEHQVKYPNYQYRPRKPSEKKKRMTKRKAALLAAASATQDMATLQQVVRNFDTSEATLRQRDAHQENVNTYDMVNDTESQLPHLVGNFGIGVQGTLPADDHVWGEISHHNTSLEEFVPDPASLYPAAEIGIAEEFGPSPEFQAAQLEDIEQIDWNTIVNEMERSSENNPGSSSLMVDDFELSQGLDMLLDGSTF